jgi:hypothetical protein
MPARTPLFPVLVLLTFTVVTPGQGQTPPLNAKVQETLMGPTLASPGVSSRISLSADGDHLALVTAKGSRQVVLLDGVEGPVFDEIPTVVLGRVMTDVTWSPTGGHSAYVGRRGGDGIIVVDGKEAGTLMTATSQQGVSYSDFTGWRFWYNHDGSRLAYAVITEPAGWVMVADGVRSPTYRAIDFRQTMLIGKRLIYVAQTADQQWHVVVDGKQGPGYVGINSLQVTPDGLHYAHLAFPVGPPRQGPVAVVDGVVEGLGYLSVNDLELAPDGRVAYTALKSLTPDQRGGSGLLVVAGKEQQGSCGAGRSPMCLMFNTHVGGMSTVGRHVAWSPDGKGFSYLQSNSPNPGVTVIVNGKPMGPTYNTATQPKYSPDGSRFAYLGSSPDGFSQVVDGEEFPAVHDLPEFQWSPDGKRYAFLGRGAGSATAASVVVDGKQQPVLKGSITRGSLQWSPDSKRFVYGAQVSVAHYGPVVDGVSKPLMLENFAGNNHTRPPITFPPFVFSPDGSRLAYVGIKTDVTGRGISKAAVYLDDAGYEGPGQSYMFPSFSPDSKHFATLITTGTGWVVMIDGKVSPSYQDVLKDSAAGLRFVDGRTYRFYGIRAGQIYRVTLDVGP